MPTNLTGSTVASTFDQLLHIDNGPDAADKTVYSGVGVATALKVGTQSVAVDNIRFDGNTISTTDTNGNLNLLPNGTGSVAATKVAITGGTITGITDLAVADGGTGASTAADARTNLGLGTIATQNANNVAITGGSIQNVAFTGSFSGMTLVESQTLRATQALGFGTGAGGTVTQATSRTTGVTLNAPTGEIVLVAGTISGHEADEFTLTNSAIGANDVVFVCIKSGVAAATRKYYQTQVVSVAAGSCVISLGNLDNGAVPSTGTDSPVLQFAVLKSVVA